MRITIEARPGGDRESILWDPWREAWVVHVRERAEHGHANAAILAALRRWLSVEAASLRWARAGRGTRKQVEVDGLEEPEVRRRLEAASLNRGR